MYALNDYSAKNHAQQNCAKSVAAPDSRKCECYFAQGAPKKYAPPPDALSPAEGSQFPSSLPLDRNLITHAFL